MADPKFQPYDEWQMHLYSPCRAEYSACIYYRVEVPFRALLKAGKAQPFMDRGKHHFDKDVRDSQSLSTMLSADIDLFYAMSGDEGTRVMQTIKDMKRGIEPKSGKMIYPPSVCYDIDDNLDWVHPFNPTYAVFGTRAAGGTLLTKGDKVTVNTADNQTIDLWVDKESIGEHGWLFDIERNKEYIENVHRFARMADGWTCPSPYLMKYMVENRDYKQGYVFPNSIIQSDWYFPKFAPRKKEIRVLWQGGASHMSDFFALRGAFKFIANKYPHVKFIFFGHQFPYITESIPAEQIEMHPWVPYDGYRPTRALIDADINLCVTADDEFSRSKSCIKFYEGSLSPHAPEATLAPNCPPYNEEIIDGETGLLYDPGDAASFAANLEHLITKADVRRRLGENARKWVLANRDADKTVVGLYEYYEQLRLEKKVECDARAERAVVEKAVPKAAKKPQPKTRAARKVAKAKKARKK